MPQTRVLLFRDDDGSVPLVGWLDELPAKVQDKCRLRIERLEELGHELRRPEADYPATAYMNCASATEA